MLSLFLLVGLGVAHAAEPPGPPVIRPAQRQVGDLAVEGTLMRLGLDGQPVTQLRAEWLPAMAAPTRSRSEGRELGWEFDVPRVWVIERDLVDGATHKTEAAGTWRRSAPCAPLAERSPASMALRPLPAIVRTTEDPVQMNEHRRSLTVAESGDERIVLLGLQPGESATIVEIEPRDGRFRGRGARTVRKLSVEGGGAELALNEGIEGRSMCVTIHPERQPPPAPRSRTSLRQQVREVLERRERGPGRADEAGDDGVVSPETP